MTINVKEIINSEIACDLDNALKIKQLIIKGLDDGEFPTIDFTGIDVLTPSFINIAIGDLYEDYNWDTLDKIEYIATKKQEELIKILLEEAKEYWSKQDLDKAIEDITPSNEYKQQQFKMHLNDVLKSIELMLTEKNRKYGNSALEPIRVFSKADKVEQLKVRIDDKINRLKNQQSDDIEDSVNDLIGYLLLLKIANKEI